MIQKFIHDIVDDLFENGLNYFLSMLLCFGSVYAVVYTAAWLAS